MPEKLLELIAQVQDCGCDMTDVVSMIWVENQTLADHLAANGVVIPVRCRDCGYHRDYDGNDTGEVICKRFNTFREPDFYCSYGERKDNG